MVKHIASIVALAVLAVGNVALANKAPPPPRPPVTQPTTASQPTTNTPGKVTTWNRAGGIALGLGAAAVVAAGGIYLSRRRSN